MMEKFFEGGLLGSARTTPSSPVARFRPEVDVLVGPLDDDRFTQLLGGRADPPADRA